MVFRGKVGSGVILVRQQRLGLAGFELTRLGSGGTPQDRLWHGRGIEVVGMAGL
jgi:hypothetical protein